MAKSARDEKSTDIDFADKHTIFEPSPLGAKRQGEGGEDASGGEVKAPPAAEHTRDTGLFRSIAKGNGATMLGESFFREGDQNRFREALVAAAVAAEASHDGASPKPPESQKTSAAPPRYAVRSAKISVPEKSGWLQRFLHMLNF